MKLAHKYAILKLKYALLEKKFKHLQTLVDYQFWEKRDLQ